MKNVYQKLDLTALRDAVTSLDEGLGVVSNLDWFSEQSEKVKNTLISGVVKNFEFVYEISVKMNKRASEMESFSPTEVDEGNFRDLMRTAGEKAWWSMLKPGSAIAECVTSHHIPITMKRRNRSTVTQRPLSMMPAVC